MRTRQLVKNLLTALSVAFFSVNAPNSHATLSSFLDVDNPFSIRLGAGASFIQADLQDKTTGAVRASGTLRSSISPFGLLEAQWYWNRRFFSEIRAQYTMAKFLSSTTMTLSGNSKSLGDYSGVLGYSFGKKKKVQARLHFGMRDTAFDRATSLTTIVIESVPIPYAGLSITMFPFRKPYWIRPEAEYLLPVKNSTYTILEGWSAGSGFGYRKGRFDFYIDYKFENQNNQFANRIQHLVSGGIVFSILQ